MPQHSEFQCAQIVALLEEGFPQRYVAGNLGINQSVVSRTLARTGSVNRHPGSGRGRITTAREDRRLVNAAVQNPNRSAGAIRAEVIPERRISDETIRRRLREGGLHSRKRARVPALTQQHRRARLAYAREHRDWTNRQWRDVLFTDESRFCLFQSDGRVRTWRRSGRRFDRSCVEPVRAFNGGSVMVWGGISYNHRTPLVVVPPPGMTARRYIDEILRPHVTPLKRTIGRNFILMQDNARPHTAVITRQFLEEANISVLPHPPMSPDLNPIEHVWDLMSRRLRDSERRPTTLQELQERLIEIWNDIPQEDMRACITMRKRLQEVIRKRGGNTHY